MTDPVPRELAETTERDAPSLASEESAFYPEAMVRWDTAQGQSTDDENKCDLKVQVFLTMHLVIRDMNWNQVDGQER